MHTAAIRELLYKMADDQLILGHRNSEWTGMGPLLEEDIAFSSMAQDKIGQSLALYTLLHEKAGEADPDTVAFMRPADAFHNCVLVELPNGEFDFSLMRHFLYDTSLAIRLEMLVSSSFGDLAALARKMSSELKYHTLHANTWVRQLGSATEESITRLQHALDYALPYAVGIFEESPFENTLIAEKIFDGEKILEQRWRVRIEEVLSQTQLRLSPWSTISGVTGGRMGRHSEHLQPLLDEMGEVFRIDPTASW